MANARACRPRCLPDDDTQEVPIDRPFTLFEGSKVTSRLTVAFAELGDPRDPQYWSGTPNGILRALQEHASVEVIPNLDKGLKTIKRGSNYVLSTMNLRADLARFSPVYDLYASRIQKFVANEKLTGSLDVVFSTGSPTISGLRAPPPTAFWADACFPQMIGFYESFSKFPPTVIEAGIQQERRALERALLAVFSSEWAANAARDLSPQHAHKIRVVPYGANLDPGLTAEQVIGIIRARPQDRLDLLFVGMDWDRKNGPFALSFTERLRSAGVDAHLHVVGRCPPSVGDMPFVKRHGLLRQANSEERETLDRLFRLCHFIVLPSKADCSPIVLCEAAAYGLPAITTRVGGIPEIVTSQTGVLFDATSDGSEAFEQVLRLQADRAAYDRLGEGAYARYATSLNWSAAVRRLVDHLGIALAGS